MDIINKYKVKTFDDIIGQDNTIKLLKKIIKKKEIPHLLISGDISTGKSEIRKLLIKNLNININNILYVNLNEDLKKNNIKSSKLFNFLKKPTKNLIIIDNYHEIELEQQYILRSFIKNYNCNSIFLVFLNNISNIIEQLSNYFLIFKLKSNSKKDLFIYLKNIINKEKLNIDDYIINSIVDLSSNFRELKNNFIIVLNYYLANNNIIKEEQLYKILNISDKKNAKHIIKLCLEKKIRDIISFVNKLLENGYSINDLVNILTINIFKIPIDNYEKKIKIIELISELHVKINNNLITYSQFIALIVKICKI